MLDAVLVATSGWLAYYLRWDSWQMSAEYLTVLTLGTALTLVCLPLGGAYQTWQGHARWMDFGNTLPGIIAVALLLVLLGTFTKSTADFARLWMGYWFILAITSLLLVRRLLRTMEFAGWLGRAKLRRVVVVGSGESACSTIQRCHEVASGNYDIIGCISTEIEDSSPHLPVPLLGTLDTLPAIVEDPSIAPDEVWIAVTDSKLLTTEAVQEFLQATFIPIRYIPDLSMLNLLNHVPSKIAGMTAIDLNASPLNGVNAVIKWCFDKLFSLLALVLVSPLLFVIAIVIKLDSPGSVFFRQQRHGWDGSIINVLKFRTMRQTDTPGQERQAVIDDPRVTRSGALLRRTSLDELPQFINVLRGDMSVVGPRPHPLSLNENFVTRIDAYMQRHRVKPGITGWAQIHGFRGETDTLEKMEKRVECDLYYIEHWSLWLDIKILLRTVIGGWRSVNAY